MAYLSVRPVPTTYCTVANRIAWSTWIPPLITTYCSSSVCYRHRNSACSGGTGFLFREKSINFDAPADLLIYICLSGRMNRVREVWEDVAYLSFFLSMGWDYVFELQPPTDLLFFPQTMIYEYGALVEWWYWQGKPDELGDKPVPVLLFTPQIPYGLFRARTRASAVGGRRLTAWVMARPC
jgi:hypothetical protein